MRDFLFIHEAGDGIVDDTRLCFGDQESRVLVLKEGKMASET